MAHSDTLALALTPGHAEEWRSRVHVCFLEGRRVAIAAGIWCIFVEDSNDFELTPLPRPPVEKLIVPVGLRASLDAPVAGDVFKAEALGLACSTRAPVLIGAWVFDAALIANALRHLGKVSACYVRGGLEYPPLMLESAEHPGRWAAVMPISVHGDAAEFVTRETAHLTKLAKCLAEEDFEEEDDAEDEIDDLRGKLAKEVVKREAAEAQVAKLRNFVALVAKARKSKPDHWNSCDQCEQFKDEAQEILDELGSLEASECREAALLDGFAPSEALPDEGQCVLLAVGNHNSVARYVSGQFIVSFGGERLRAEMDHVTRWWPLPYLRASASLREPSDLGRGSAK